MWDIVDEIIQNQEKAEKWRSLGDKPEHSKKCVYSKIVNHLKERIKELKMTYECEHGLTDEYQFLLMELEKILEGKK